MGKIIVDFPKMGVDFLKKGVAFLKIVVEFLKTGVDILKTGVATLNCEACPPPSKIDVNCWCFNEMSALVSLWFQDYS